MEYYYRVVGWYMEMHWLYRLGLAALVLTVPAAAFLLTGNIWGWPILVGVIMLCLSFPNRDDRSKYNF